MRNIYIFILILGQSKDITIYGTMIRVWMLEDVLSSIPFGSIFYAKPSNRDKVVMYQHGLEWIDPSINLGI